MHGGAGSPRENMPGRFWGTGLSSGVQEPPGAVDYQGTPERDGSFAHVSSPLCIYINL